MKASRPRIHSGIFFGCLIAAAFFSGCAMPAGPAPQPPPAPVVSAPSPKPAASAPASVPVAPRVAEKSPVSQPIAADTVAPETAPPAAPVAISPVQPPPPAIIGHATIRGSEEASLLLDDFTVFVESIDGKNIPAGRPGWNTPVAIDAGRRTVEVEFNRGVFVARATLQLEAKDRRDYEVKYSTDAELFGGNSYCNFWIIDRQTGLKVTEVRKAAVGKISVAETKP